VQAVRADLRAAAAAVQELSDCGEASEGLCPIRALTRNVMEKWRINQR
jgi:hypothetical protein